MARRRVRDKRLCCAAAVAVFRHLKHSRPNTVINQIIVASVRLIYSLDLPCVFRMRQGAAEKYRANFGMREGRVRGQEEGRAGTLRRRPDRLRRAVIQE
jgi:hypothetical protein